MFGNSPENDFKDDTGKINYDRVKTLYTEMKKVEKEKLKKA